MGLSVLAVEKYRMVYGSMEAFGAQLSMEAIGFLKDNRKVTQNNCFVIKDKLIVIDGVQSKAKFSPTFSNP